MGKLRTLLLIFFCLFLWNCQDPQPKTPPKKSVANVSQRITALPKQVRSPANNPSSPEKELLGKLLFYDPILSGNKDVACASCHHPNTGYAEFLDVSIGTNGHGLGSNRVFGTPNDIPLGKRNAPTVINAAYNGIDTYGAYDPEKAPMFWDDRVQSLEKQALEPIRTLEEMRGRDHEDTEILAVVIDRLRQIPEYRKLFREAFGTPDAVTVENLGKAIATFERTLVTNNSRFDKYMRGDETAIYASEKEGFELFKKVGCATCHNGPMLSDYKPHVLGVPENDKVELTDRGVGDTFAFRTPTLRNLRYTAPYMHNGSIGTLKQVMEFYEDIASGKVRNPEVPVEHYDPLVREIKLSVKDMSQIISFMNTLNDPNFDKEIPKSVPSGLPVAGNIQ